MAAILPPEIRLGTYLPSISSMAPHGNREAEPYQLSDSWGEATSISQDRQASSKKQQLGAGPRRPIQMLEAALSAARRQPTRVVHRDVNRRTRCVKPLNPIRSV